jgi:hypothetical protein
MGTAGVPCRLELLNKEHAVQLLKVIFIYTVQAPIYISPLLNICALEISSPAFCFFAVPPLFRGSLS